MYLPADDVVRRLCSVCKMTPSKIHVLTSLLLGLALLGPCFVTGRFTMDQIDQLGKACNASEEDLVIAKSYKVPTSETGKCLMKCMINKLGLLNNDGTYNKAGTEEALKNYWPEWPVAKIVHINDKCYEEAKLVTSDVIATCTYAYTVMECINKQSKLFGLL